MRLSGLREKRSSEAKSTSDNKQRRDLDITRSLLLQQPVRGADPVGVHTVYCSSREECEKLREMQSVYQHLISLLLVFSTLQVQQLTEGCSCALTHPQDAFCNSDIGK